MQEEVDQKTIALSMKTGKLTAQVLQAALKKYLQHRAKGKTTLHHGQQSLKQLKKHGAALSNIEITEANIGAFKPCAKKYGVDFALRKDKTTQPPHYVVIFKSKDADNLEQAFREFTAKTLSKEQRPSIRKVLSAMKQKTAEQTKQRAGDPQSPVSDFCVPVRKMRAGVPAGRRCRPVGKAPASCGRFYGGLCKSPPQPAPV